MFANVSSNLQLQTLMMKYLKYYFPCLLIHFLQACLALTTPPNITTDQSALLSLKPLITSEPLAKNWSVAFPVCQWTGVTCGARRQRVTALNISNMGFAGMIPPPLGNLSFLVSLDLSGNNFHGELPPGLSRLRRLRFLNLGVNDLSGEIPSWFGFSFPKLQYLNLANNSFLGSISPLMFSNLSTLEQLRLSFNNLEGTIPKEIGNLQNLKKFICEGNQLSGSLPSQIFNISSLEAIALRANHLSGSLPSDICRRLQRLFWLNLSENKFNGEIPSTLSQCSALQMLSLSINNFTGVIPNELGNLTDLQFLYLGSNNLEGTIPGEIGKLTMLNELAVSGNNLAGKIPGEIGNLTMLVSLSASYNDLTGLIPQELGNLYNLEILQIQNNSLSGSIPVGIFNLSRLISLSFAANQLSGNLPQNVDYGLSSLTELVLSMNNLDGVIPNSISNCSQLKFLELSSNQFRGSIPCSLGNLSFLRYLGLHINNLTGEPSPPELSFITCLANCKNLKVIEVSYNPSLIRNLPDSIQNLSSSLEIFSVSGCNIKGIIPNGIGNLSGLTTLYIDSNQLIGSIPDTIGQVQKLQGLYVNNNKLSHVLPDKLCSLQSLAYLILSQNHFSGSIPECLGNITSLRSLYLDSNRFDSGIPAKLFNLKDILELNLSSNSLSGTMALAFGNLKVARYIDLSLNSLSGGLPTTLGDLQNLQNFVLANNRLQGSIPESIGNIFSLELLDLSHNHLSGSVPPTLVKLKYLTRFNVSFNNLSGEIPSQGPFKNFTSLSFISNDGLCGDSRFDVPPCPPNSRKRLGTKRKHMRLFLLLGVATILVMVVLGFIIFLRYQYRKKDVIPSAINVPSAVTQERISYYELLQATDEFNESNLLGSGSFGSVYRGILGDGKIVAIKVFNLLVEGASKSFDAECQVLRNLRHRNLTKVISSCSNDDFKALVLEFMPNGCLEKWLYSHNNFLDINQRLNIMIDVASALQYLHDGYSVPVVHCDLKPSNVLLDQDMVAHVSDFGISKLLANESSNTYTKTLATFGYLAPEYGSEGLVSRKCDIYSYGILLMEVFTRRQTNDEMFGESLSLRSWVNDSVTKSLEKVIDPNLLSTADEVQSTGKLDCISSILKVALNCSEESPKKRCSIQDVLVSLEKIKLQMLTCC